MSVELSIQSDLDYLIPALRVHLWDLATPPVYTDEFLRFGLLVGLKSIMQRWNRRYYPNYEDIISSGVDDVTGSGWVTSSGFWDIERNPDDYFVDADPPTIMYGDERPIVLAAAIAIKSGMMYTLASTAVSWRDEEISFNNVAGVGMQEKSLARDLDELDKLLPERRNRLAQAKKQSLLGFRLQPNWFEAD